MRAARFIVFVALTASIAGCGSIPVTPNDLREYARSGAFGETETVKVKRPYETVVQSVAARAPECLKSGVRVTTTQGNTSTGYTQSTRDVYYTPSLVRKGSRAELYLQQQVKGTIIVGDNKDKIQKDGWYIMVVDIIPEASGVRLDIYRTSNLEIVATAIKQWAAGTGKGCPDMTKV